MAKKEHKVTVILHEHRYVAVETDGRVAITKNGNDLGIGWWRGDQIVDLSAIIPDDVCGALEEKIKKEMDRNWGED